MKFTKQLVIHILAQSISKFFSIFPHKNRVLLVKMDAIGDYILFRTYLEELITSPQYSNFEFYFFGTTDIKQLYNKYDRSLFKGQFWINRNQFSDRLKNLIKLSRLDFDIIISPTFSPSTYAQRFLLNYVPSRLVYSTENSASNTDFIQLFRKKTISIKQNGRMEYEEYASFFSRMLNSQITSRLYLENTIKSINRLVAIVVSAGVDSRSLPTNIVNWAVQELSKINNNTKIVLLGQEKDKSRFIYALNQMESHHNTSIQNVIGNTTLIEYIDWIQKSTLLICPDTSALHIGAAFEKKIINISKGDYYSRFVNYDSRFDNIITVYPKSFLVLDESSRRAYRDKATDFTLDDIEFKEIRRALDYQIK